MGPESKTSEWTRLHWAVKVADLNLMLIQDRFHFGDYGIELLRLVLFLKSVVLTTWEQKICYTCFDIRSRNRASCSFSSAGGFISFDAKDFDNLSMRFVNEITRSLTIKWTWKVIEHLGQTGFSLAHNQLVHSRRRPVTPMPMPKTITPMLNE